MQKVMRDILASYIKPFVKDMDFVIILDGKVCEADRLELIVKYNDQVNHIKIVDLLKDLKNGKLDIT